eukprot:scaffold37578_cov46-Phaeocystis_antarctica.AAC.1
MRRAGGGGEILRGESPQAANLKQGRCGVRRAACGWDWAKGWGSERAQAKGTSDADAGALQDAHAHA